VKEGGDDEDAMDIEETEESLAAGRFVEMFLRHLLKGIDAKEKFVRLRVCQLIALAMNSLGEIEYTTPNTEMITNVVTIYSRIYEMDWGKGPVIVNQPSASKPSLPLPDSNPAKMKQASKSPKPSSNCYSMTQARNFPSNPSSIVKCRVADGGREVRRAVLFNLEQTRATILFIIERARDVDAINRRCVYSRSMNEIGDFRILSIGNRERILRWGLRDRDGHVKKAAVRMFAHK